MRRRIAHALFWAAAIAVIYASAFAYMRNGQKQGDG